mmetsp:Transcript_37020/g.109953  ORF Transcript_37020/g.109953 Transcript_37020/m.109953 type:complete len:209 (-) Transcript_37020:859-1485(-)
MDLTQLRMGTFLTPQKDSSSGAPPDLPSISFSDPSEESSSSFVRRGEPEPREFCEVPFSRPEKAPSGFLSRGLASSFSGPARADMLNCGCASGPRLAAFRMTFRFILPVWKISAERKTTAPSRIEGASLAWKWNLLPITGSLSIITRTMASVCTMALMTVENSFVTKPAAQPCDTARTTIMYWYWPHSPNHSLLCDHCSKNSPNMPGR